MNMQKKNAIWIGQSDSFNDSKLIEKTVTVDPNDIKAFLQHQYQFRYNEITGNVEIHASGSWIRLDDRQFHSVLQHIKDEGGKISESGLNSILMSDFVPSFNPFRDYFDNLPQPASNVDYIKKLASQVKTTDQSYWEKCLRKWLVAAVACSIDDSVVNQTVLIFKGKQGIGKSTYLLNLVPGPLQSYIYSGVLNPSDKDTMSNLAECFLINLDELETLTKWKEGALKEIITKSSIRIRRPYSRFAENMIRRASFTGSVNHDNILHDSTGSRRFLIHEVISINYQHAVDMDKVWAQAYSLFKAGYQFYFDMNEIKAVNSANATFEVMSVEEELLLEKYEPAEPNHITATKFTATEILKRIHDGDLPSNTRSLTTKIGRALSKHGFKYVMNNGRKFYYVKNVTQDDESESDIFE